MRARFITETVVVQVFKVHSKENPRQEIELKICMIGQGDTSNITHEMILKQVFKKLSEINERKT